MLVPGKPQLIPVSCNFGANAILPLAQLARCCSSEGLLVQAGLLVKLGGRGLR